MPEPGPIPELLSYVHDMHACACRHARAWLVSNKPMHGWLLMARAC